MTLPSRKKRPTTVPTFRRRSSLGCLIDSSRRVGVDRSKLRLALAFLMATPISTALAQFPAQALRPVPREGTRMVTPTPNANAAQSNLVWRRSPNVAPEQPRQQNREQARQPIAQTSGLQVAGETPDLQSVSQSAWMTQPARVDDLLAAPPAGLRVAQNAPNPQDFFNNPFADDPSPQSTTLVEAQTPQSISEDPIDEGFLFPAPDNAPKATPTLPKAVPAQPKAVPTLPSETRPMNELRDSFGFPQTPDAAPQSNPRLRKEDGPSLGDMLRDTQPNLNEDAKADVLPPPNSDAGRKKSGSDDGMFDNPFPSARDADDKDADADDRDKLNDPRDREDSGSLDVDRDLESMKNAGGITCTDFRERIAFQTIDKISLDISPPYRPDEIEQKRYERLKADFDEKQSIRQWRKIDGTPLASGRLRDLAYENAIIETDFGTEEQLPINQLSEADLAYISENWGLPSECLVEQVAYVPRSWTRLTMTYKASNLCHTPLYFEDVNLERYGHTHGPVLEPLVQSAHFFGNIAILPYKMGVHAPNECTYSLGYYRPGNCAPWITPPVPISLRGALYQGAAVTGLFWLIP